MITRRHPVRPHPATQVSGFPKGLATRLPFAVLTLLLLAVVFLPGSPGAEQLPSGSGTHLLPPIQKPVLPSPKLQLRKVFVVGDTLTVPAFSFQLIGGHYQTTLTCRLVGEHCNVFVENEVWGSRVSQSDVASVAQAFDRTTPADPTRGIFATLSGLFGNPPDVDGDPRILIAIIDVLDSPILGYSIVGYFDVANQAPPVSREIVYLDANPFAVNSTLARATIAHEFQHLLHWQSDPDEDKWIDEGFSEYAELACGYKDSSAGEVANFLSLATNTPLTDWQDQSWDFERAYLWTTFLVQTYGQSTLRTLVGDRANGILSVNNTLAALGRPERFDHLFGQWTGAVYRDDFAAIALGSLKSDALTVPTLSVNRNASLWGADYLTLGPTSDLALTVAPTGDNDVLVTLIQTGTDRGLIAPLVVAKGRSRRIHTYGSADRALAVTTTSGTTRGYTLSVKSLSGGQTRAASDFDADGEIGFSDFLAFVVGFGKRAGDVGFDPTYDLNNDRQVAFADFLIFVKNFGTRP
jgi:hypothetical protein